MFFSLVREAVAKARLLDDDFNCELVCAVANHYKSKDQVFGKLCNVMYAND